MSTYKIRTAAKAMIEKNNQILLIKHKKNQTYYTLPGGGQDHNESLSETLERECLEEVGARIIIKDLAFVFEYIGDRHENSIQIEGFHQIDLVFESEIHEDMAFEEASEMDETQIGFEWVDLKDLNSIVMYPMALRGKIINYFQGKKNRVYLGEIQ